MNQRSNWRAGQAMGLDHPPGAIGDGSWNTDLARSTPTTGKAAVAFMSDSFGLSADTPHHMRPAGTMMPKDQGESIPSFNRTQANG